MRQIHKALVAKHGERNWRPLALRKNIAVEILEQGRFSEAEALLSNIIDVELGIGSLHPGHPDLLRLRFLVVRCLDGQGRVEEADRTFDSLSEPFREAFLPEHHWRLEFDRYVEARALRL